MFRFLSFFLLLPALLHAQINPTGDFRGTLVLNKTIELQLVVHVRDTSEVLTGSLDSPDQGAFGIPANEVRFENDTLRMSVATAGIFLTGTFDATGDTLDMHFKQGYTAETLRMVRFDGVLAEPKRPQTPQAPFPYRIEEVSFHSPTDDVMLAGTFTIPAGEGPFPAVLLVSGSGPQDRDETLMNHQPFWVLADYLSRRGIAVLRYDDRGVGESTGNFATATSFDFADDAAAGVRWLHDRPEVNRVGVMGHSEGGMIAPIVAVDEPEATDFIVLLAGPGVPGPEVLKLQSRMMLGGVENMTVGELKWHRLYDQLWDVPRQYAETDSVRTAMIRIWDREVAKMTEEEIAELTLPEPTLKLQLIAQYSTPWFLEFLRINPADYLAKLTLPVLAVNGSLDLQVDAEQNLTGIESALQAAGNTQFEVVRFEGLNHLFQTAETGMANEYGRIEETFNEAAMAKLVEWILSAE